MSGLLVSVRSAAEAHEALAGGADLLDVKEPRRGALGPATPQVWEEVRAAAQRVPTSAALGELLTDPVESAARRAYGFRFAKIGLAGCAKAADWRDRWARAVCLLDAGAKPVAVVYADWREAGAPPPYEVVAHGKQIGCEALLVDTHGKQRGNLFDHFEATLLSDLCASAKEGGMLCLLGGSLTLDSIDKALALEPDYVAVRGAACEGSRAGSVKQRLVADLAARVAGAQRTPA